MNKKHYDYLFSLPQVIGVGQGLKEVEGEQTQEESLIILVKTKLPLDQLSEDQRIPQSINGLKTDVIEVGEFQAQDVAAVPELIEKTINESDLFQDVQRTSRVRPAVPGLSIGHYKVTAGTFGAVVYDLKTGEPLILSNNHILANSSNGRDGRAKIGDPILQPGAADGGLSSANVLAKLMRYYTLDEAPQANEVDCALARPIKKELIAPGILGIGLVSGVSKAAAGMSVKKSGRTTGITEGQIRAVNVTTSVNYGQGRVLKFANQIFTTKMSEGGDSGSLVLDANNKAIGLLFAGSDQGTLLNPIETVLKVLKVQFK